MLALDRSHPHESVLLDFIDGVAADAAELEQHLDLCDECRRLASELAQTSVGSWSDTTPRHPSAPRALPQPGMLLAGRFRVGRPLGHGAMGLVFEGVDEALDTRIALKVFWPSLSADTHVLDSIRREVSLGRRIVHPNVRRVFDVETSGGITFIVMELVDGDTLEAHLGAGAVGRDEAVRIVAQICDALSAAHAEGIVHRDLKPGNIALDGHGRVIVMDFGLARDVNAQASRHQGRGIVGTPAYWAPEQARGEAATAASDIYSLGLIAYRLLVGEPYTLGGENKLAGPYRAIVDRCLASRPGDRFPSASAARRAFLTAGHKAPRAAAAAGAALVAAVGVMLLRTLGSPAPVGGGAAELAPPAAATSVDARGTGLSAVDVPSAGPTVAVLDLPASPPPKARRGALAPGGPTASRQLGASVAAAPRATSAPSAERPLAREGLALLTKPQKPRRPIDREDPYTGRP